MQAIFGSILIIAMVVSYKVGKRKGYSGILFVFLTTICPIMPIIALVLPDKSSDRAEAEQQKREMDEMRVRIRELEQMQQKQQKPEEKKAPAEKHADVYTQGMQFYRQKEYFKAYPLLEEAARQGRAKAQYTFGIMHRYGQGCKLNEEEALRWLEAAGEQGHLEAQKACASMYTVEKKDTKKALYWHEKAAEQGDAESQYACAFYKRDNKEEARYWAEKAAAQGHEGAQTLLKQLKPAEKTEPKPSELPKEEPVKQNQPTAEPEPVRSRSEWLTEEERDIQMTYIEGVRAYDMGLISVALVDFNKAAAKGHLKAQMYCGQILYDNGNHEKALYWYEKAAEQGLLVAQQNCAAMYANGEGCTPDPEKVLYWYEKAAKQGDDDAQLRVGMAYNLGRGCMTDLKKARYWYEKAAAQGNERAKKLLSNM